MFSQMKYVYEVYREKSFSKAAQKLYISQPALSAHIRRTEDKIGYPLFDRSTTPIKLTECGQEYIRSIEQIMGVEKNFEQYLADMADIKTGHIVIGGTSRFASYILPSMIGDFLKKYPSVRIDVMEESTSRLEKLLFSGMIDLLIDNDPLDESIYERYLYQDEHLILAVPQNFPVNEGLESIQLTEQQILSGEYLSADIAGVPLDRFKNETFLLQKPTNDTCRRAVKLCQEQGFSPKTLLSLDQQMTAYNMSCTGLGVSFVSDSLICCIPKHPNVVLYKLDGEAATRGTYFYRKHTRYLSRLMSEFLETARHTKPNFVSSYTIRMP